MWCVIKNMYEASRRGIFLLEGEKSATFRGEPGVAQDSILFSELLTAY